MGRFVNPDNSAFQVALNSKIYVDKTGMIGYTNKVLGTRRHISATAAREDLASRSRQICLVRITAGDVIQRKCSRN